MTGVSWRHAGRLRSVFLTRLAYHSICHKVAPVEATHRSVARSSAGRHFLGDQLPQIPLPVARIRSDACHSWFKARRDSYCPYLHHWRRFISGVTAAGAPAAVERLRSPPPPAASRGTRRGSCHRAHTGLQQCSACAMSSRWQPSGSAGRISLTCAQSFAPLAFSSALT